ncbi:hypothetical protein PTI98_002441 [Pleurotus ostreatus]|nr:hypothetical protein PTI98_002441 [Pleurotus ostreatus]
MFSFKSAIFVAIALAALTAATPTASMARRNTPASSCSTSSLACFQNSGTAKDAGIASLIATLGIDVGDIDGLIGATCSPITGIGAGGCIMLCQGALLR